MSNKRLPNSFFLQLGITFFLAALLQFSQAKKAYLKVPEDYQFSMLLFIILIVASALMIGIYIGRQGVNDETPKEKKEQTSS